MSITTILHARKLYTPYLNNSDPATHCRASLALSLSEKISELGLDLNWPDLLDDDFDVRIQHDLEFQIRWAMELIKLSNQFTESEASELKLPSVPYTSESVATYIQSHRSIISKRWIWNRFNLDAELPSAELYRYTTLERMLKRSWTVDLQHNIAIYDWQKNPLERMDRESVIVETHSASKNRLTRGSWSTADDDIPFTMRVMKYATTQNLYGAMMGQNPSRFKGGENPVEQVSWHDAILFANTLSACCGFNPVYEVNQDNLTCHWERNGWRLPTEEEWGFLASGNGNSGGAWYGEDYSTGSTHPVGQKEPNGYGLYDMGGNVSEWTWDLYTKHLLPGSASSEESYRVLCGGCWYDPSPWNSTGLKGSQKSNYIGFRLIRMVD